MQPALTTAIPARKFKLTLLGPAFIAAIGYIDPATSPPTFRQVPPSATSCCGWWYGPT